MIRIQGRKDYMVALESVAMTDIVLNMFIFFFISFSLLYTLNPARLSKIEVRLPKASTAVALEGSERVTLAITKDGEFFIDDERVSDGALRERLSRMHKANPAMGLVLKVDGLARFDSVANALDIINELGIQRVSVAAVKKE